MLIRQKHSVHIQTNQRMSKNDKRNKLEKEETEKKISHCCLNISILRCVPPGESIDLINVAFEQKTIYKSNSKKRSNKNRHVTKEHDVDTDTKNFNVPDRITGRNGMAELMTLNPERQWNFVEVC